MRSYGPFKRADFHGHLQKTFSNSKLYGFGTRLCLKATLNFNIPTEKHSLSNAIGQPIIVLLDDVKDIAIGMGPTTIMVKPEGSEPEEKWWVLGKYQMGYCLAREEGELEKATPEVKRAAIETFVNYAGEDLKKKESFLRDKWGFGGDYLNLKGDKGALRVEMENKLNDLGEPKLKGVYQFVGLVEEDEMKFYTEKRKDRRKKEKKK